MVACVNLRKIAVEPAREQEIVVEYRSMFLDVLEMFSAPYPDRKLLRFGDGQARNVVVPVQLIPKAIGVIIDVFFRIESSI